VFADTVGEAAAAPDVLVIAPEIVQYGDGVAVYVGVGVHVGVGVGVAVGVSVTAQAMFMLDTKHISPNKADCLKKEWNVAKGFINESLSNHIARMDATKDVLE